MKLLNNSLYIFIRDILKVVLIYWLVSKLDITNLFTYFRQFKLSINIAFYTGITTFLINLIESHLKQNSAIINISFSKNQTINPQQDTKLLIDSNDTHRVFLVLEIDKFNEKVEQLCLSLQIPQGLTAQYKNIVADKSNKLVIPINKVASTAGTFFIPIYFLSDEDTLNNYSTIQTKVEGKALNMNIKVVPLNIEVKI